MAADILRFPLSGRTVVPIASGEPFVLLSEALPELRRLVGGVLARVEDGQPADFVEIEVMRRQVMLLETSLRRCTEVLDAALEASDVGSVYRQGRFDLGCGDARRDRRGGS